MKFFTKSVPMEDDHQLEIEVRYRKDRGTSWFSGQQMRRGLVLDFTPVKLERFSNYTCKSYKLGDDRGRVLFLEEWDRVKPKRGREVAALVESRFEAIAALALAQDWQRIFDVLKEHQA